MTGTSDGDIILWDELSSGSSTGGFSSVSKRAAKIIRIHNSAITSLTVTDKFLVSGGADGYVRFFDGKLRLAAWFEVHHIES